MSFDRSPFQHPLFIGVVCTVLGLAGGGFSDRIVSEGRAAGTVARLDAREHSITDLKTAQQTFVSRNEFAQFQAQITDIKADLREIKQSLLTRQR